VKQPTIHDVEGPDSLNSSSILFYNAVVKNNFFGADLLTSPSHAWVDVRDVAAAHIRALETPSAAGERIIVSAGSWVWQDMSESTDIMAYLCLALLTRY
jgi:nucleoside-diphosphate-sugar epimerase